MRVSVGPFDPLPTYECQYVYGIFSDVKLNSKSKKGYIVVKIWKEWRMRAHLYREINLMLNFIL